MMFQTGNLNLLKWKKLAILIYTANPLVQAIGAYRFKITIEGEKGIGILNVPFEVKLNISRSISSLNLVIIASMVVISLSLLIFLAIRMGKIGSIPKNQTLSRKDHLRGWIAGTGVACLLIVYLSFCYYLAEQQISILKKHVFHSMPIETQLVQKDGEEFLSIKLLDKEKKGQQDPLIDGFRPLAEYWTSPLIPDHGKFMHLFLIQMPDYKVFAHLHPIKIDNHTFLLKIPPLPRGDYALYSDIVHENGFSQTLVNKIELKNNPEPHNHKVLLELKKEEDPKIKQDEDDSWRIVSSFPKENNSESSLSKNYIMHSLNKEPLIAGKEETLKFEVTNNKGEKVELEPYMGMAAHGAILSKDGQSFAHIHPMGTISGAAAQLYSQSKNDKGHMHMNHGNMHMKGMGANSVINMPFIFPSAGEYMIWVQVKINGERLTGYFLREVEA